MKKSLIALAFGVLTASTAVCVAQNAAQDSVVIDVASTFPGSLPLIGEGAYRLAEKVERASGGEIRLKLHEPGSLVAAADTVNAVSDGRIPAAWAGAGWFASKDSAFNMFSSVPFGPGMGEYLAWMYNGDGLNLAREMFEQRGVHNIPCIIIPPEASGWFRNEIKSVADLKGLKMRFFGLGAKVMEKLGAVTQQLPPGDILKAFESGAIDAAEFSLPAMDLPLGLHKVAKYYYFPGWHQQATLFDLYINKAKWDSLSEKHKAIIEQSCGDTMREMIAKGEANQWVALKEIQGLGVRSKRWPPKILIALENAWQEVVAEESERSANFKRIYDSYAQFRKNYAIWRYLGSL